MTMPVEEPNSSDDGMSSKKGVPWSAAEHTAFLKGLQNLGKGNWRGISRMFVPSRSPTQVASHAQKYFLRLNGCTKRRSRFSGLEQGAQHRPSPPPSSKSTPKSSAPASNASPTSSADGLPASAPQQPAAPAPPAMMPMPFMFPPMMFALPGGASFVHPMFYQSLAAAGLPKGQNMMVPMMFPGMPQPELSVKGLVLPKVEGGDDSAATTSVEAVPMQLDAALALPRPAARRSSTDQLKASELLSQLQLCGATSCHVALHASAQSAFRPAGRQLAV